MSRITTIGLLAGALAGGCTSPSEPSELPDGYRIVAFDGVIPANVEDTVGPHRLMIRRVAVDSIEVRLLAIAETLYPPIEDVHRAADRSSYDDVPESGAAWWYDTFDGIRLPYAATAHAVAYYHELSRAYEAGDPVDVPITMLTTGFLYEADVEYYETLLHERAQYSDVYVARLRISWGNYCGNLCAMSCGAERTVILNRDGSVLHVTGDGVSLVVVS